MTGVVTPPLIKAPFGESAAGPYITQPIPDTTATPGRASFELGFPPLTMAEIIAGGIPPFGQDVNGILYMITANIAALTAGQPYKYSSAMATAIGGYALGTILGMADGTGLWKNALNGNTSDPDASGAGWVALYRYGYTTVPGLVGGIATLTLLEAASPVIVLEGTLVGNLQVVLPNQLREWLIVNRTTGAFTTTTVKTAAGTGVIVPQGGYDEPVAVYGDGTNLYPTVTPLTIASDVAATPDTFAVRDNLGQLYATGLNIAQTLTNPAIGAVLVEADSFTGFVEKITPANFLNQLFGARSLTANGSYTLPFGFTIKWGTATAVSNGDTTVTYPTGAGFTAFTTFSVPVVSGNNNIADQDNGPGVYSASATQFVVRNSQDHTIPFWWIAVGF